MIRAWASAVGVLVLGLAPGALASGMTQLKNLSVVGGTRLTLVFDAKVQKAQVKTEYFNDIIQISLNDVGVYPARIFSVSGSDITKVFAYQYAPRLVRVRLSVKGKSEAYRDRYRVQANGKSMVLDFSNAATATPAETAKLAAASSAPAEAKNAEMPDDEKQLLKKVSGETEAPLSASKTAEQDPEKLPISTSMGAAKPHPNPLRALGGLGLVLALFCGTALAIKKLRSKNLVQSAKLTGLLGRWANKAGLGATRPKMIEIVSTHYLGPKQSIAVARICGRMLVLGITNDAISLITQLNGSVSPDAGLDELLRDEPQISMAAPVMKAPAAPSPQVASAPGDFAALLGAEKAKPNFRAQIKSRVEGLKPL